MQEQIIGFEVAKLAKDKGFDLLCKYAYDINKKLFHDSHCNTNWNDKVFLISECSAPTQALLQKWLREKHNIDVVVSSTYLGYNVVLWNRNTYKSHHMSSVNLAEKYEDVLEIGLIGAFKLIE